MRWRDVPGYEGLYRVSDHGWVRSCSGHQKLGPGGFLRSFRHGRYPVVTLYRDGVMSQHPIHVLVLEAFAGPRPPGFFGCHQDDDPDHVVLSNLYWGTHTENVRDAMRNGGVRRGERHPAARLRAADVLEIRAQLARGARQCDVARQYRVDKGTISDIVAGRTWKHLETVYS